MGKAKRKMRPQPPWWWTHLSIRTRLHTILLRGADSLFGFFWIYDMSPKSIFIFLQSSKVSIANQAPENRFLIKILHTFFLVYLSSTIQSVSYSPVTVRFVVFRGVSYCYSSICIISRLPPKVIAVLLFLVLIKKASNQKSDCYGNCSDISEG